MKVLHIVETFAPLGGAELYMISQIALLEGAGIENVVIYWNEHPQTFPDNGYPVYHLTESESELPAAVAAIIKEVQPTIIYLHIVRNPAVIATAARLGAAIAYMHDFYPVCPGLAKFYRRGQEICTRPYGLGCVPMIYLHRCASAKHPLSVYRIMQDPPRYLAAYKQLKKVLVASSYMKDLLVESGLGAKRITILPYFVHMPGGTSPVSVGAGPPQLLFIGRLEKEKGLVYLLQALARLSRPYRLLVAGEGHCHEEYEALTRKLGIADKVDFLGWLSSDEIMRMFEKVVCLVFPSIWPEPFGMVGIEAFYNSRPVIAFDVGGVSDWLQDGWSGYLVPPQDVEQLADRIDRLLTRPELASQMGSNGYSFAYDHYRAEQHLEHLLSIFETALE